MSEVHGPLSVIFDHHCWTARRSTIYKWLLQNRASLAELYLGAVFMLYVTRVPGWTRFVTHAVREIGNRLPDSAGWTGGQRVSYTSFDRIARDWRTDVNPPGIPSLQPDSPDALPEVVISGSLGLQIQDLVARHLDGEMTLREKYKLLIVWVWPESRVMQAALGPIADEWVSVIRSCDWGRHDSGKTDNQMDAPGLERLFDRFESLCWNLVSDFLAPMEELDAILEDANTPAG
jgi:hypothetical protein